MSDLIDRLRHAFGADYDIGEELLGGGMSRVFRAHERLLGRDVVIKVQAQGAFDAESSARFRQEIALAAALQHPQIVPLLAARDVDGAPAFVMPFVAGDSLRVRLARGPLSIRETVSVLLDVARALAYAHASGVTHRDVKPDNILLVAESAVVTDFGIAKLRPIRRRGQVTPQPAGPGPVTNEGISLGTAAYMAPEQAVGDPHADHRADLYSLGAVAFEMLVGSPPFVVGALHQLLAAQLTAAPPRLESRRADVPPRLATLVHRCLEKDPAKRPRTAEEIVRVLQSPEFLDTQPPADAPPRRDATTTTTRRGLRGAWRAFVLDWRASSRSLRRTPIVAAVCVVSLAFGIGANAAIFSLVDQTLLRPPPIPEPHRVVMVDNAPPVAGSQSCGAAGPCTAVLSEPMLRDLQRNHPGLDGLAAFAQTTFTLSGENDAVEVAGLVVTGSYFPTLHLGAAHGRLLTAQDDSAIGGHPVAVISYELWTDRFGRNPDITSRHVLVDGQRLQVVGVAPRGFNGTVFANKPQLYVPLAHSGVISPTLATRLGNRRWLWLYGIGRLSAGVDTAEAALRLNAAFQPLSRDRDLPLHSALGADFETRFASKRLSLTPVLNTSRGMRSVLATPLRALFVLSLLVLLAACANVASILLARASTRRAELTVRSALGAARGQLVRLMLLESVILAVGGGLLGIALGTVLLRGIERLDPSWLSGLTYATDVRLLTFGFAAALVCGLACGVLPAWQATGRDLMTAIRAGATHVTAGRSLLNLRGVLVTSQLAVSTALLVLASLFLSSLSQVRDEPVGFDVDALAHFTIAPARAGYDSTRRAALFQQIQSELSHLPGIQGVGSSATGLLAGNSFGTDVSIEGVSDEITRGTSVRYDIVAPGTLTAIGARLVSGRDLDHRDGAGSPRVVVVNEAFVELIGRDSSALGRRLAEGSGRQTYDFEIVGVIRDVRATNVKSPAEPMMWLAAPQLPVGAATILVRSENPAGTLPLLRETMRRIAPELPITQLGTLRAQFNANTYADRALGRLIAAFGLLATLIAAVGLYGSVAYSVAQRTREIGVRLALGATGAQIVRLVLRRVTAMYLIGLAAGIALALSASRLTSALLYGIAPTDPRSIAIAVGLLTLVMAIAAIIPALRATRVLPTEALRAA